MESSQEYFTFLRARDPSIVTGNITRPKIVCKNLFPLLETGNITQDNISEYEQTKNLEVYLRIKPAPNSINYQIYDNSTKIHCTVPANSSVAKNTRDGQQITKSYTFDRIFNSDITQKEIFNSCVKPSILNFINGFNSTLMAYGASGSGKTYTILGTTIQPGIIPRALEYVFKTVPGLDKEPKFKPAPDGTVKLLDKNSSLSEIEACQMLLNLSKTDSEKLLHSQNYSLMQDRLSNESSGTLPHSDSVTFCIWVSFIEIYNEFIYDLLTTEPTRGKIRPKVQLGSDTSNRTFVKDLTFVNVRSGAEAYQLLQHGKTKLKYASTLVNSHSSRSHCIFTIHLIQADTTGNHTQLSHFNFCDLAGSERAKTTCNVGARLKESNNINTSLHVLGRCITSVRNYQKNNTNGIIPFRESKLTRLFQNALSGNENVAMIVNVNPTINMFDETQQVLNFSAIAKDIIIKSVAQKPQAVKKSRFSLVLEHQNKKEDYKKKPVQSSTLSVTAEVDEVSHEQIAKLSELNEILLNEVAVLRLKLEQQEAEIRTEVTKEYSELLDKTDKFWKKRLEDTEDRMRDMHQWEMEKVQEYFLRQESTETEETARENERKGQKRPRLNSDDDDVEIDYEGMIKTLEEKLAKNEEARKLLEEKNVKLQLTINDAINDYKELEDEKTEIQKQLLEETTKNLKLQEETVELKREIQMQKQIRIQIESEKVDEDNESV